MTAESSLTGGLWSTTQCPMRGSTCSMLTFFPLAFSHLWLWSGSTWLNCFSDLSQRNYNSQTVPSLRLGDDSSHWYRRCPTLRSCYPHHCPLLPVLPWNRRLIRCMKIVMISSWNDARCTQTHQATLLGRWNWNWYQWRRTPSATNCLSKYWPVWAVEWSLIEDLMWGILAESQTTYVQPVDRFSVSQSFWCS